MIRYLVRQFIGRSEIQKKLGKHFNGIAPGELVTSGKDFPVTSRVDVQTAPSAFYVKWTVA